VFEASELMFVAKIAENSVTLSYNRWKIIMPVAGWKDHRTADTATAAAAVAKTTMMIAMTTAITWSYKVSARDAPMYRYLKITVL